MRSQLSIETATTPEEQANNVRLLAALPRGASVEKRDRIVDYEIVELAALLRECNPEKLTAEQVFVEYWSRITQFNGPEEIYGDNGKYNAFVRLEDLSTLLEQARLADEWLTNPDDERGPAPPLCGIPFGIKDSVAIKGLESKNGTQAFSGNLALRDATCVARLRAQGAIIIGHTICSELSTHTVGQFAGNAWDPARTPGGSSQGSGVAPVARLCAATLGEETTGSIIIPAAANGASAIKPSLGLVSGAGVMPLRSGWDVIGPMARSIRDASLVLSILAGPDGENDPQSLSAPPIGDQLSITPSAGSAPLEGLTIGIPQTDWMSEPGQPPAQSYDQDYSTAFIRFKDQLVTLGARVIEFPWLDAENIENIPYSSPYPFHDVSDSDGGLLMSVNAQAVTTYANQVETRHWSAVRDFAESLENEDDKNYLLQRYSEFFDQVASLIPVGIRVEAENRRREQQRLFEKALNDHQIDFMMVLPLGAHVGERAGELTKTLPVQRRYFDMPNALAWPMLTLPIGYGATGVPKQLPVTAAFWGRRFSEPLLVQAAIDFQTHYPEYHTKAPPDPDFASPAAFHIWTQEEIPPQYSADPLVITEGRRKKS
ncbi:amidase [Pseudomonas cannabina]|uniref:Glutamyl-tRNA amidotransferase, A subunit n=1 Tax=Pseudomonas cannabina TaxID=86840 RepID=A0A0P9LHW0_PSECA|nr:amidase [Pseudomonas cannabina]KAA8707392.1 amidase [Pseudomonas cannabina]KPW77099.1 Glutamyl-tRNA amidotransferase, A subunit [Pseudomonas cannabina]RMN27075.1 Glutamyl-tRNA amidotransferase, A subunit [Pseudomonas cannabina]SDR39439.1 Asp-tRNAAsn/Glu-tRNAGln amidotransferase A subunit [Pseudomonas cannabina]